MIPLAREKEFTTAIFLHVQQSGGLLPEGTTGMKPTFPKQISFGQGTAFKQNVPGDATPKSIRWHGLL